MSKLYYYIFCAVSDYDQDKIGSDCVRTTNLLAYVIIVTLSDIFLLSRVYRYMHFSHGDVIALCFMAFVVLVCNAYYNSSGKGKKIVSEYSSSPDEPSTLNSAMGWLLLIAPFAIMIIIISSTKA